MKRSGDRVKRYLEGAFSLVEVTLAIGIVAFALTAMLGTIPSAMSNYRDAEDRAIAGRILEEIGGVIHQADFQVNESEILLGRRLYSHQGSRQQQADSFTRFRVQLSESTPSFPDSALLPAQSVLQNEIRKFLVVVEVRPNGAAVPIREVKRTVYKARNDSIPGSDP